jgi:MFS family permease
VPLTLLLRKKPPLGDGTGATVTTRKLSPESLGLSPRGLQSLLIIAGLSCCVAMAMPQVHLVAYCSDLGYGPARGAEMLSLMLACGIVSRLVFGGICDRIGGLRTLLLGSVLQGTALLLFLPFNGLVSLYVISALFGCSRVASCRRTRSSSANSSIARKRARASATVIMATLFGMALGGWMSGAIFDVTGSYRAAFLNGSAWNLVNVSIVAWLLRRSIRPRAFAA